MLRVESAAAGHLPERVPDFPRRTSICAGDASLVLFVNLACADVYGSPILDAAFEPGGTAIFGGVIEGRFDGSFIDQAQTFVVGTTGFLTSVEVLVDRTQDAADLLVDIRLLSAGIPSAFDGGALLTASAPFLTVPTRIPEWVAVTFLTPLAVTTGDELALVLRTRPVFPSDQNYSWRGDTGDKYLNGHAFVRSSGDGALWTALCGFDDCTVAANRADFGFRTYVDPLPVPEPSVAALLTIGLVVGTRRLIRRKG